MYLYMYTNATILQLFSGPAWQQWVFCITELLNVVLARSSLKMSSSRSDLSCTILMVAWALYFIFSCLTFLVMRASVTVLFVQPHLSWNRRWSRMERSCWKLHILDFLLQLALCSCFWLLFGAERKFQIYIKFFLVKLGCNYWFQPKNFQ